MSPVNKFPELLMSMVFKLHPDGSLNFVNSTNIDSVLLKCGRGWSLFKTDVCNLDFTLKS